MKFIFDIFLILLMTLIIFINTKRGFVRSVWSSVTLIGSFAIAYAFGPMLGKYLFMDLFLDTFTSHVFDILNGMLVTVEGSCDFSELISSFPDEFIILADSCGANLEALEDQFSAMAITEEQLYNIASSIALPVSKTISNAVGIIALFLASVVVLTIVGLVVKIITKISVIQTIDRILGFTLGLIEAIIVLCILCVIAAVFVECSFINSQLGLFFESLTRNSIIFRLFSSISPVDFINIG